MNIEQFMQGYKAAWEQRDEKRFVALFSPDGQYHNTPFAVQRGSAELAQYWQRVKLQDDVHVAYEVLADTGASGIAHWHTTYQVASEELFQIWARSTGTNFVARKPGEPLPRMPSMAFSSPSSSVACAARPGSGGTPCRSHHEPVPLGAQPRVQSDRYRQPLAPAVGPLTWSR